MKLQEINDSDENTAMGLDSDYQENYQKVLKQSYKRILSAFLKYLKKMTGITHSNSTSKLTKTTRMTPLKSHSPHFSP
jgi:hypothetical protein